MTPEAEEIYNRLKLRPRKVRTAGAAADSTKTTAKTTAKTPPKSES